MRAILEIPLSLGEIISATEAFAIGKDNSKRICAITTDTREMQRGDLFIALSGERYDGESFCHKAEELDCDFISAKNKGGLLVKSTRKALLSIAKLYKSKLIHLRYTVAITGSVGKSTTKEMLGSMLSGEKVHLTRENYNNYIGLSYTVLSAPQNTEYMILELGANHPGEIKEMSLAIEPDVAVITKIGTAHIGSFGSREMIAKAKLEIRSGLSETGILLIPHGEELLPHDTGVKTVSDCFNKGDYSLVSLSGSNEKTEVSFCSNGTQFTASPSVFGAGNLRALAFAAACMSEMRFAIKSIIDRFSLISHNNTRQTVYSWQGRSLLDDSYNASFESVVNAFSLMMFYPGRRCAVLGDVLELGNETENIHFKIGSEAVNHGIELLFLFGVYAPFIERGAISAGLKKEQIFTNTDVTSPSVTLDKIQEATRPGDVILFKASHRCNFSKLCESLRQREEQNNAG